MEVSNLNSKVVSNKSSNDIRCVMRNDNVHRGK